MKIIKVLLLIVSIVNILAFKDLSQQDNQDKCNVCQKVVYQLKFDKMADCGNKACKHTCHRIVHDWNAPNSIFTDFQNDVLGKCDICFRGGYCTLTQCDAIKSEEVRLVNHIVENGIFRGKINKQTGEVFTVGNKDQLSPCAKNKMEKNLKKSLKDSILSDNARAAADQVGSIVNNYVLQAGKKENEKVIKRNVVYKNFILQANIVVESTDKEIYELKALLDEYGKMKDYKTVSPMPDNTSKRTNLRDKMTSLLKKVKNSIEENLKLVHDTLRNLDHTEKKSTNFKQGILIQNTKTLNAQQKKHIDRLETEINSLAQFKKPLMDIQTNFLNKLATIKSFTFKLR